MCLNQTPDPVTGFVLPCRKCRSCIADRINDVSARALAELYDSTNAAAFTLTFSDENLPAVLEGGKRVFQEWFNNYQKRIKRKESCIRSMHALEHGKLRGRPHFHMLAFFDGPFFPDFTYETEKWTWDQWPYGFTYVDHLNMNTVKYVAKYSCKALNEAQPKYQQPWFDTSRRPILGYRHFRAIALEHVKHHLAPKSRIYTIPDVDSSNRRRQEFFMTNAAFDNLTRHFIEAWDLENPNREIPHSEAMELFYDREARRNKKDNPGSLIRDLRTKNPFWSPSSLPKPIKIRMPADVAYIVCKLPDGTISARQFDEDGEFIRYDRILHTYSEVRNAMKGGVEFRLADYVGEGVF